MKVLHKCLFCNKKFFDYLSNNRKYCSRSCHGKNNTRTQYKVGHAPNDKNFKTGKVLCKGYVMVLNKKHPNATLPHGYIREHRIVMESIIGHHLLPEEVVHHKNGIKSDNRKENLQLFNNHKEHRLHHVKEKRICQK